MSIRNIWYGIMLTLSGLLIACATSAQAQHPYCIQALSDIKTARWLLQQHIGSNPMTHNEKEALRQMNELIREMNEASILDGKQPDYHPKALEGQEGAARLRQCIEFLKKAKDDFSHEENSQFAGGLRDRSVRNCDEAIKFVEQAMHA